MTQRDWIASVDPDDLLRSQTFGIARLGLESEAVRIASELGLALASQQQMICTAESCTGGAIARALTETTGSSAWFDRSYITYSNQAKQDCLKVPLSTLEAFGAVSEPVVQAMAAACLRLSACSLAVSVSGVAGPTGGSVDKPVGTVCFGWALRVSHQLRSEPSVYSRTIVIPGDRYEVRLRTVCYSLLMAYAIWSKRQA